MKRYIYLTLFLLIAVETLFAVEPTGTLPVMYVTTAGGAEITSKEDYLDGNYYMVANGYEQLSDIGSADKPLPLQIRGRGNYTWTNFDKKPFRLKLNKKADLMGTGASKHYCLLPHCDDYYAYLRNTVGFELSRRIGLAWTPGQVPVELVLNGDYRGLYFLTEQIKVATNRVNMTEQNDLETDPSLITGGWLMEIDNYWEDGQLHVVDATGTKLLINIAPKSPEVLSTEQYNYMYSRLYRIDSLIKVNDKADVKWEQYIDIDTLACFYIINELMDNIEAFHGSCWIHKERGDDTKLLFGPVWDFGNAFSREVDQQDVIYRLDGEWKGKYSATWIKDIVRFPRFVDCVKRHWNAFFNDGQTDIDSFTATFHSTIATAAAADSERWPALAPDFAARDEFLRRYHSKVAFLDKRWNYNSTIDDIDSDDANAPYIVTDAMGRIVYSGTTLPADLPRRQLLIIRHGNTVSKRIYR